MSRTYWGFQGPGAGGTSEATSGGTNQLPVGVKKVTPINGQKIHRLVNGVKQHKKQIYL